MTEPTEHPTDRRPWRSPELVELSANATANGPPDPSSDNVGRSPLTS